MVGGLVGRHLVIHAFIQSFIRHSPRVLAAELHLEGDHPHLARDVQARVAAGEGDGVDARVLDQVVPDLGAAPGDDVEQAGREARGLEAAIFISAVVGE